MLGPARCSTNSGALWRACGVNGRVCLCASDRSEWTGHRGSREGRWARVCVRSASRSHIGSLSSARWSTFWCIPSLCFYTHPDQVWEDNEILFSSGAVDISTGHVTGIWLKAREVGIKTTVRNLKCADDGGDRWDGDWPATAESCLLFQALSVVYGCSVSPRSFKLANSLFPIMFPLNWGNLPEVRTAWVHLKIENLHVKWKLI